MRPHSTNSKPELLAKRSSFYSIPISYAPSYLFPSSVNARISAKNWHAVEIFVCPAGKFSDPIRSRRKCPHGGFRTTGRGAKSAQPRAGGSQDFVIGGYTVGGSTFDALGFGYYEGKSQCMLRKLIPDSLQSSRRIDEKLQRTRKQRMPVRESSRVKTRAAGPTAHCRQNERDKPVVVGEFEFLEWLWIIIAVCRTKGGPEG
jgi:hypothetical protein